MPRPRIATEDFLTDPHTALARARRTGWLAELDFALGVLSYEDARASLGDPRLRASFPDVLRQFGITSGAFYDWMAMSPLNRDGDDHKRWRAVFSRTFTPRSVERIEPFLVDSAHGLIDGFAARGECEFMAEFADAYRQRPWSGHRLRSQPPSHLKPSRWRSSRLILSQIRDPFPRWR